MKTNTRKTTRILCASTIAAMTLLGSVAPALTTVMAAGDGTTSGTTGAAEGGTPNVLLTVGENKITFDKKIYLDENENVPNATINYTLDARDATNDKTALEKEGYYNVVEGDTSLVTVSSTEFSATDSADKDKNYISKPAEIDASSLVANTKKPTVYTYTLTEKVDGAANQFVTPDKGTTRKLNIFVGYKDQAAEDSKTLSVIYSTLALEDGTKVSGFENKYLTFENENTKAIKVTKKVTGNQGDKTAKFNFTVTITGQHSKVTATTTGDENDLTTTTPTATNSTVTVKTKLKNDQSLTLRGLTKGATYEVVEDDAGKNGYTTTPATTTTGEIAETVVTNNRSGVVPTGIYLNHKLPFNILGVALAGGAVALIAKKRHEDALEDEDDE